LFSRECTAYREGYAVVVVDVIRATTVAITARRLPAVLSGSVGGSCWALKAIWTIL